MGGVLPDTINPELGAFPWALSEELRGIPVAMTEASVMEAHPSVGPSPAGTSTPGPAIHGSRRLRRIYEYCYPLEDARARQAYGMPSGVNNILIINKAITPGRVTAIIVKERLGS
jgi:hypothetical protein